ncbi:hypothetical protein DID77_03080 [Candidatus Marinamargulisbacteria bacterium SCGC AG-439-L15]|nr:hypothetical protein DID77_03080 [Candidatus Marinamargulisbacteria bacterium SCGC AG-439-L15]
MSEEERIVFSSKVTLLVGNELLTKLPPKHRSVFPTIEDVIQRLSTHKPKIGESNSVEITMGKPEETFLGSVLEKIEANNLDREWLGYLKKYLDPAFRKTYSIELLKSHWNPVSTAVQNYHRKKLTELRDFKQAELEEKEAALAKLEKKEDEVTVRILIDERITKVETNGINNEGTK